MLLTSDILKYSITDYLHSPDSMDIHSRNQSAVVNKQYIDLHLKDFQITCAFSGIYRNTIEAGLKLVAIGA